MSGDSADAEAAARLAVAAALDGLNVSRETLADLERFEEMLRRWTRRINLISRNDEDKVWSRHILDSFGLASLVRNAGRWIDLGSGGGLPALPLAILAKHMRVSARFELYESDRRKAAFLRAAARELTLPVTVIAERAEAFRRRRADVVSARALAPLAQVLALAEDFCDQGTILALLKGEGVHDELTDAARCWHIVYQAGRHPLTLQGYILMVRGFSRAHEQ